MEPACGLTIDIKIIPVPGTRTTQPLKEQPITRSQATDLDHKITAATHNLHLTRAMRASATC